MNKRITERQLTINRRKDDEIRELDQMKTMFEKPLIELMENKLGNNNNNANQNEVILMNNDVLGHLRRMSYLMNILRPQK